MEILIYLCKANGQPTDLGKQFLAIPPFMNRNDPNKESLYVVVLDEGYGDGAGLSKHAN